MLPQTRSRKDHPRTMQSYSNHVYRRILYRIQRSTLRERLGIAIGVSILWFYIHLLNVYGTIAPPATMYYTKYYGGLSSDSYPPMGWKAPFRVVFSLTTTPNRLDKIQTSIQSLLDQSYAPDAIYLNVPEGPMKRHPERSYDEVEIPKAIVQDSRITVVRSIDYGPATKLIPALLKETDPDTLVITVDDDFVYPERLAESLAWEAQNSPEAAIGACGWGMMPFFGSIGMVPVYSFYAMRPNGRYVDILQACCGNAYRRRFFPDVDQLADIPPVCITVDDVWIAGYLAMVSDIKRAIISKRLDPSSPDWKNDEPKSAKQSLKLSSYNDKNEIHYKCVLAMEKKFGKSWKRVYQEW